VAFVIAFEPRGWPVDFRRDLAHACRTIAAVTRAYTEPDEKGDLQPARMA